MGSEPQVVRRSFRGGQRILVRSEEMLDEFRRRLREDGRVGVRLYGANTWKNDGDEWPYYLYVVRKSRSKETIDESDVIYLDELIDSMNTSPLALLEMQSRGWMQAGDQEEPEEDEDAEEEDEDAEEEDEDIEEEDEDVEEEDEDVEEEDEDDEEEDEDEDAEHSESTRHARFRNACAVDPDQITNMDARVTHIQNAVNAKHSDMVRRLSETKDELVKEISYADRAVFDMSDFVQKQFSALSREMDSKMDSVVGEVNVKIGGLLIDELRRAAKQLGDGDAAQQLLDEAAKREGDYQQQVSTMKEEIAMLRQELQAATESLNKKDITISEKEDDIDGLEFEKEGLIQEKAAWHTSKRWSSAEIDLIKALSQVRHDGMFWKHLKQRCPAPVDPACLAKSIQQLLDGTKETKPITGYNFFEYRCNLRRGHKTGRLYFEQKDGVYVLLGFADDKDHQDEDIRQIGKKLQRDGNS